MIQHEVFTSSFYVEVDQDRRELIAELIRNKKFSWVRNCQAKVRLESQSSFPDVEPSRGMFIVLESNELIWKSL